MEFRAIPPAAAAELQRESSRDGRRDVCIHGIFSDRLEQDLAPLRLRFGEGLAGSIERLGFKAKVGEKLTLQRLDGPLGGIVLVGLGAAPEQSVEGLRRAAAMAAKAAQECVPRQVTLDLQTGDFAAELALRSQVEAYRLALFRDQRFKSEADTTPLPELVSIAAATTDQALIERALSTCAGVELARELVAAPPNVVTPAFLAETARELAQSFGLTLKLLEREDCARLGMGAYLGVAACSDSPPKFIHLTYRPPGEVHRRLVLVGKGLTFDSGGYNLKVGNAQIELMKYDMGGCGAVLGAARGLAELKPSGVEVHFISATCENMISGAGLHPGDILTASNGRTIEVNNTDAEGRLTLADALVYASGLEPDALVDLATLTGACVVALGDELAGLWSPDDVLARQLLGSAKAAGEGLWRMPLRSSYKDGLKSQLADIKNTGPRAGGSITAALFLRDFVGQGIPWAHLDIAGPVWSDKGRATDPAGASGYGVRTLMDWVLSQAG